MKKLSIHIYFCIATINVAMLFSCGNINTEDIPKEAKTYKFAMGEAENFQLMYTDSTQVKAILNSSKNLDYSNQFFPYTEFPNGLKLEFFNDKKEKSTIEANYGIYYPKTHIVELRDSVKLTTHEGKVLKTNQLYWNERSSWVFTEKPFIYLDTLQRSITKGIGMDFNRDFTKLKAHKITGIIPLKD